MATPGVSPLYYRMEAMCSREIQRTETASSLLFKITTSMEAAMGMIIDYSVIFMPRYSMDMSDIYAIGSIYETS